MSTVTNISNLNLSYKTENLSKQEKKYVSDQVLDKVVLEKVYRVYYDHKFPRENTY